MTTSTSITKVAVETKIGTTTKTYRNTTAMVWNSKRRYK